MYLVSTVSAIVGTAIGMICRHHAQLRVETGLTLTSSFWLVVQQQVWTVCTQAARCPHTAELFSKVIYKKGANMQIYCNSSAVRQPNKS